LRKNRYQTGPSPPRCLENRDKMVNPASRLAIAAPHGDGYSKTFSPENTGARTVFRKKPPMDAAEFDRRASETLKRLMIAIEDGMGDALEDIDLQGSVLTVELSDGGTYVINKHAANQEIWLSSPKSGAAHFKPGESGAWLPTRGGETLHARLEAELSAVLGAPLGLEA
jgi:frataxin